MSDRAVMDVLLDAGDDRLVVITSVKALCIDLRDDLVIFRMTGGFVLLLGGMIGVGMDMVTELGIAVVVSAVIALEVFVTTVSCVGDVRAGV